MGTMLPGRPVHPIPRDATPRLGTECPTRRDARHFLVVLGSSPETARF
jgi:hypothetical protein